MRRPPSRATALLAEARTREQHGELQAAADAYAIAADVFEEAGDPRAPVVRRFARRIFHRAAWRAANVALQLHHEVFQFTTGRYKSMPARWKPVLRRYERAIDLLEQTNQRRLARSVEAWRHWTSRAIQPSHARGRAAPTWGLNAHDGDIYPARRGVPDSDGDTGAAGAGVVRLLRRAKHDPLLEGWDLFNAPYSPHIEREDDFPLNFFVRDDDVYPLAAAKLTALAGADVVLW